jgi:hypothetical protein
VKKYYYECDRCGKRYETQEIYRGVKLIRTEPAFGQKKKIDLCDECYTKYIINNREKLLFTLAEPKRI